MSVELQDKFNIAAVVVKKLKIRPSNDELLRIYSLYKQATVGNCNTEKPGIFSFSEKSKWEAWNGLQGMDSTHAKELYVRLVEELVLKYGTQ